MIPRHAWIMTLAFVLGLIVLGDARADIGSKVAQETAKFVLKKFGKKVVSEGAESFAERISSSALRHGDDVIRAVRRVGPSALSLADEAGEKAPQVLRLLAKHRDDAAVWVIRRPAGMKLLSRYGDDAAEALIKHKGLAKPVIEKMGTPALKALGAVGPQQGRRLAMMADAGELASLGHTTELLQVIAKHGDGAMNFIWRNKGPLALGTSLTAFLANPEAFINGTNRLAGTIGDAAVKPLVQEAGRAISTLIWVALAVVIGIPAAVVILAVKSPKLVGELVKGAFLLRSKGH